MRVQRWRTGGLAPCEAIAQLRAILPISIKEHPAAKSHLMHCARCRTYLSAILFADLIASSSLRHFAASSFLSVSS